MTKSEMDYMDWSLLGPTMLFLNQYFNNFFKEYYILWICMVSNLVIKQLQNYLENMAIKLFKMLKNQSKCISILNCVST